MCTFIFLKLILGLECELTKNFHQKYIDLIDRRIALESLDQDPKVWVNFVMLFCYRFLIHPVRGILKLLNMLKIYLLYSYDPLILLNSRLLNVVYV